MKLKCGKWVASELLPFAAVVVGVPNNAAFIQAFNQHHAGAGAHVVVYSGQRHGIGFRYVGANGFVEPLLKL